MFRRMILNWLSRDDSLGMVKETRPSQINKDGMNFSLYTAVGGHVLECRNFDHKADRHTSTLYMIDEAQNFADQVAKSIMLEMMKQ